MYRAIALTFRYQVQYQADTAIRLKIIDRVHYVLYHILHKTHCICITCTKLIVMVTLALLTYPCISPEQVNNSTIVMPHITSTAVLSFFQRSAARL